MNCPHCGQDIPPSGPNSDAVADAYMERLDKIGRIVARDLVATDYRNPIDLLYEIAALADLSNMTDDEINRQSSATGESHE